MSVVTSFDEPLKKAVGRSAAPLESALGISTVGELLRHYPRRYAQRGELTAAASRMAEELRAADLAPLATSQIFLVTASRDATRSIPSAVPKESRSLR